MHVLFTIPNAPSSSSSSSSGSMANNEKGVFAPTLSDPCSWRASIADGYLVSRRWISAFLWHTGFVQCLMALARAKALQSGTPAYESPTPWAFDSVSRLVLVLDMVSTLFFTLISTLTILSISSLISASSFGSSFSWQSNVAIGGIGEGFNHNQYKFNTTRTRKSDASHVHVTHGGDQWQMYQVLGKLHTHIYMYYINKIWSTMYIYFKFKQKISGRKFSKWEYVRGSLTIGYIRS